jgi:hypothetical protein
MFRAVLLRVAVVFLAVGCGSDGPAMYGPPYGYACRNQLDCSTGLACVERDKGTCWPICATNDCGTSLVCRSVGRHGDPGSDDVCVPR